MTVADLRQRRLLVTGRKTELLARLKAALLVERDHAADYKEEDIDYEDDEDEEDEKVHDAASALGLSSGSRVSRHSDEDEGDRWSHHTPVSRRRSEKPVLLIFRDVEGSMKKFSDDNHSNIIQWLQQFEEMASLCSWNEVQKIIYAKQLLEVSAKLFVNYEGCAKTWKMLMQALIDEFEEAVDTLHIHRELSRRKKRSDETLQEYAYKMLDIAAPAKLNVRDVTQYNIIEGIPDDAINKTVLYGAKTMSPKLALER